MPETSSRTTLIERAAAVALALGTAWVAVGRVTSNLGVYVTWSDRDLARSAVPFWSLPTSGPELSYGLGARIPGGAFHVLWWMAQQINPDPGAVWQMQVALDALACALLGAVVARRAGALAGAVTAALLLSTDPNAIVQLTLWNPAWVTPFVAVATAAWVRVVFDRDPRALPVWLGALALGTQMHISVGMLALTMAPGIWMARAPGTRKWLGIAVLTAIAMWAPYLVSEARTGFPNSSLLFNPAQVADHQALISADAHPFKTFTEGLRALSGENGLSVLANARQRVVPHLDWMGAVGPALMALGLLVGLRRTQGEDRLRTLRIAALVAVVLTVGELARARPFNLLSTDNVRYLLEIAPVWAALGGLSAAALLSTVRGRSRAAAGALSLLLTAAVGIQVWGVQVRNASMTTATQGWTRTERWLDALSKTTTWSRTDIAGRVVVATQLGDRPWNRETTYPIDNLLLRDGSAFPGSRPPPCGVVFVVPSDDDITSRIDAAAVAAALGPDVPPVTVDAIDSLGPGVALARYHPELGRCPTNMIQRYLPTAEEELARTESAGMLPGTARRLADDGPTRRWVVKIDASQGRPPAVLVPTMLEVVRKPEGLMLTLHANALRGHAWNSGAFVDGRILRPRLLVLDANGQTTQVAPIAERVVGRGGDMTPILALASAMPGAGLRLEFDVQPDLLKEPNATTGPTSTVAINLPDGAP